MSLCRYVLCKHQATTRLLWPDLRSSDYCLDHARAVWRLVEAKRHRPVGFSIAALDHSGDVAAGPVPLVPKILECAPGQGVLL